MWKNWPGRICGFDPPLSKFLTLKLARYTKAPPVRAGRKSSVPLKELAEERDILITDSVADLLHSAMIAFQEALGSSDAQFLYVEQRRVSSGLLEAANKIALAHARAAGGHFKRKGAMKVFVEPLLCAGDRDITVFRFQRNNRKSRLPGARRINQQRLRALYGDLVTAVLLDQVQAEVERGVYPTAAVEAMILSDHQFRHPPHLGIFLAEYVCQAPVRGRALAVEESGRRHQTDP